MKRLFGLVIIALILFIIYYDLSKGTLPITIETTTAAQVENTEQENVTVEMDYFEKEVVSGDTVLSIIESQLDSAIPVSIQEVINDFSSLNKGISVEKIQIGKTYKFPNYANLHE
ncbi:hypothetical protein EKG37_05260 [Robertmurraya yapensis]|uniref:LysM domain-containing protein n=2 Tax=Bacillaceae TaxID=186817 RepID=A0A431WIU2_9BACI|nr:hypothetical protein [Bacillus yapensis]RTR35287.1 hypothetical protein EKG37_05260 [Bacillus yapensis]TKS97796.1 hypothetical protein FAR12_05260 [Bacillus yapensis]